MKPLFLPTSARLTLCAAALLTGFAVQAQSQPRHDGQMPIGTPRGDGQMQQQPMQPQPATQNQMPSTAPRHDGQMPIGTPRGDVQMQHSQPSHSQPPMHQGQMPSTAPRHEGQMPIGTPSGDGKMHHPKPKPKHHGQAHSAPKHSPQPTAGHQRPQAAPMRAQAGMQAQGQLTQYEQNALRRCGIFKTEADRNACVGRVLEPQVSGSVQGGGVLRSYTEQVLVPAQ